jgi:3',5'-cyclic AMP phosphodiesterase CpdA
MPLHIPSCSRRDFVRRALLGTAGILTCRSLLADERRIDPDHWLLFSDTHIAGDIAAVKGEVNMADHLRTAIAEALAKGSDAAGLFVNGDCSLDRGLAEDYGTFTELLKPISAAGLPIHLTLGNHDDREVFINAVKLERQEAPPVASKHVSVVEGERANWFLLDSLDVTKQTPGRLGDEQRAWLAKALDARPEKPALVMVHHDPLLTETQKKASLLDSNELTEVLRPRRHVKALFFGHTHVWKTAERDGIHLVNLPAVAYTFAEKAFTGWTDCHLRQDGMKLQLQLTDQTREEHGQTFDFTWRA